MHQTSAVIKTLIENTPGYGLDVLAKDLGMSSAPGGERFLNAKEAAAYLSVSHRSIYRWMQEGDLPFWIVKSERRFKASELDALIKKGGRR
ncbi:MAG: hypothetical protein A2020_16520 [Lentisphaerae bacterium GWF2_45_14]|nr:MAG: hypothetical protein A2020_16520 [Lentisphaerae bacterium GWF2_45_14]